MEGSEIIHRAISSEGKRFFYAVPVFYSRSYAVVGLWIPGFVSQISIAVLEIPNYDKPLSKCAMKEKAK
jgi:hypothetical protein